ncbi:hypothetical protein B5F97_15005 [Bacteroides clarus]|uniref:Glycosyltransferase n=1 Tax=Bacteroides clarus TaxID=626929 RepID=A0A1Y3YRB4_9BACE|nr:hypothetical protein B5F97_15005 [Bacteroides clarus]
MIPETLVQIKRVMYQQRKYMLQQNIINSQEPGITPKKYCNHNIVVSLTTFGKRIHDVAFTIESIMEQTMKANRIILWLDFSFENKILPIQLEKLKDRGLEIYYCRDIRSYKKIIPTLQLCPNDAIITIDDDLLYENDIIERLINAYLTDMQYIYCSRYHEISFDKNGILKPYCSWNWCGKNTQPSHLHFATTGAGTLFPPHCLDDEVFNEEVFKKLCFSADDVWINCMAAKKGTLIKKIETHNAKGEDYLVNEDMQDIGLFNTNISIENNNDKQLKAVFEKYDIYKYIRPN